MSDPGRTEDTIGGRESMAVGQSPAAGERVVYAIPLDPAMVEAAGDEIDIFKLWGILWESKWIICAVTALFAVAGVAYALLATEWYRAEVLLAPAQEKSIPGGLGQLGGLAGLAGLAGISIGGGGTAEPIAVLQSREFASKFIEDLDLVTVLLADDWDAEQQRWKDKDPEDWPDIRDAVKYFEEEVRSVSVDKKTGLVTLGIEWTDPVVAAEWANLLVGRLNGRMRQRALVESERNVHYLREEMAATNVVSLQQSIGRLLEAELQKLMLARGNEEFSFRVIDPATPPKKRESPKRALVVLVATILGGLLAVIGVYVRHSMRKRASPNQSGV
jgi:uncharacterized protein involved in exopolysaccharide biosynthesis